jgi:hypothetical protein
MTPREMLQVLRGLDNGAILAAGPKRAMDEGCLGWDRCPTSTTSHWKGGDWENASAEFETYLGTIEGVPVVAVMNSPVPQWRLTSIVDNAQTAATTTAR